MENNTSTETPLSNDLLISHNSITARKFADPNFLLIWLAPCTDGLNYHNRTLINSLRNIFNNINEFIDIEECIDLVATKKENYIFLVLPCCIGKDAVSRIHDMSQIDSIYVLCEEEKCHEKWTYKWPKIRGVFKEIMVLSETLQKMVWRHDQNHMSLSILSESELSNTNVNQLDKIFMYTKLLKEVLVSIEYDEQSIKDFSSYCRQHGKNEGYRMADIDMFEGEYRNHSAIYWYTYPFFIYQILNQALRTENIDTIVKMGFFIHDLNQNIKNLHQQQLVDREQELFTFYRGQKLPNIHFEKLVGTKNGLLSFNNFLSTTEDRAVAYSFAESNQDNLNFVAVLFEITVDTSTSSAPFAFLGSTSYFGDQEKEVLFSTHTVFRINEMRKINQNNDRFWLINLNLTTDDDHLLAALTKRLRIEIEASNPQDQLGQLLIKLDKFNEAKEIYHMLLNRTDSELGKATYSYWIGYIKYHEGEYDQALSIQKEVLETRQRFLSDDTQDIGNTYEMIGLAHSNLFNFSESLSAHRKAHEIREKYLPDGYSILATSKLNIGLTYIDMEKYSEALTFLKEARQIYLQTLGPYHPHLATAY